MLAFTTSKTHKNPPNKEIVSFLLQPMYLQIDWFGSFNFLTLLLFHFHIALSSGGLVSFRQRLYRGSFLNCRGAQELAGEVLLHERGQGQCEGDACRNCHASECEESSREAEYSGLQENITSSIVLPIVRYATYDRNDNANSVYV